MKAVLVIKNLFCLQSRGNKFGDDLRLQKAKKSFSMDRLLLCDENAHHYVLILDLERVDAYFNVIACRSAQRICRNCFHLYTNGKNYQNHVKPCSEYAAAEIIMPKQAKLPYSSKIGKHTDFFLLFYTLTQNLIFQLFQLLQHHPHPLLPTQ